MGNTPVKAIQPAEAEVNLRLQNTLQVVREDEARFKRVIEVRRLERRAKRGARSK